MENIDTSGYEAAAQAYQQHTNNAAIQNSALGKLIGTDAQYSSQEALLAARMQNEFSSVEAAKNRNWQEYMSNTANQRAVKDLEAAGFSPLALLGNSGGASTPGGSAASAGSSFGGSGSSSGDMMKSILGTIMTLGITSANMAARSNIAKLNNETKAILGKLNNETKVTIAHTPKMIIRR